MTKIKILVVDDEEKLAKMAKLTLEDLGIYKVHIETSGCGALAVVSWFKPDLILLDLMIPDMNGLEICKRLKGKEKTASIPVIILSGNKEESYKVSTLDSGADDYIVKPFSLSELDARIRAVLRRGAGISEDREKKEIEIFDTISINVDKHQVMVKGKTIELTPTEFAILKILASRMGSVFSRSKLLDHLWDSAGSVTERTVDVHIKHLREKLGDAGKFVINVRGIGYKLDDETKDD